MLGPHHLFRRGCTDRSQPGFLGYLPMVVTSLRLVMSHAVQKGIPLEIYGLHLNQIEVCNVRWRTVLLDMVCLTVLEISQ